MVEKINISYSKFAIDFLDELIFILYNENYFGFIENAESYVDEIYDSTKAYILLKQYKKSPEKLKKHGNFYVTFKVNKKTTWYIFFNKKDNKYLVKYITNNHNKEAIWLNLL